MSGGTRITGLVSVVGLTLLVAAPLYALSSGAQQPPENQGPTLPKRPTISARTTTSLEVRWNGRDKAGKPYRLLRVSPGNPIVLASGKAPVTTLIVQDTGLLKDTVYCYQAEVDEPGFGIRRSSKGCSNTLAGQAITRLEILLTTADIADAGTDDAVFVDAGGHRTYLDHDIDDFTRGASRRYDLTLVGDTADIRQVTLGKTGTDGWCVKALKLLVNGRSMFRQSFTGKPGGCLWLDNEGGAKLTHTITTAQLHAHQDWAKYQAPLPALQKTAQGHTGSFQLSAGELRERIEGMVGNAIHGTALYWHETGQGVEVAPHPTQGNAIHVTVRVGGDAGIFPDANITITFDLVFALSQTAFGQPIDVTITDANPKVRSTGSWDDDGVEEEVRQAWPGVDLGFRIDVDAILKPLADAIPALKAYIGRCCDAFAVTVDAQANVTLSANLSPAPTGGVFPQWHVGAETLSLSKAR
ncbi:MAG: hypothetical protein FJZ47_17040 [Candidatus Tectomicrobia bacterium]|uniref:Uncharacterized protein n=1 Tax=Tectimicrobiota bacterium TaxID=2528274 RepID=A0A937W4X7_UNCTE|nr:hypothetical protein [Candidatus Tectomicrobia bacterium]